jgi:hypothetical protein
MSRGLSFVPVESERAVYPLPFQTVDELIDRILGETPIGMRAAARMIGQHSASLQRHATRGLLRPDGSRLRLEAIKHGGRLLTSKQALKRFIAAQNEEAAPAVDATPRSPAARSRASERAAKELEAAGC